MTAEMEATITRLSRALAYAENVHAGVMRKGTDIPYLAHVVGVSAIVMETGGSEDEAIAGLLHDTLEDGGHAHRCLLGRPSGRP